MRSEQAEINLLIHSSYPVYQEPTADGVSQFTREFITCLRERGVNTALVCPSDGTKKMMADYTVGFSFKFPLSDSGFKGSVWYRGREARAVLEHERPDIFLAEAPEANVTSAFFVREALKMPNRPVLVGHFHSHMLGGIDKRVVLMRWLGRVLRIYDPLVCHFDYRLANSADTAMFYSDVVGLGEFDLLYNGIDTDKLHPDLEPKSDWLADDINVYFTARWDKRKGGEVLLAAMNKIVHEWGKVNYQLFLGGGGKQEREYGRLIKQFGLEKIVHFLGVEDREMLARSYRSATVFVSPAIKREGAGRTWMEAEACGTPVVITYMPGHRLIEGSPWRDFCAEPNDVDSLAYQIVRIGEMDPSRRREMGLEGRQHILRYSNSRITDDAIELFRDYLKEARKRRELETPSTIFLPRPLASE